MRHKSGQIEPNQNQSNSNFSNSEAPFSSSVPSLTDVNYEFLFNQLLEGVAHGWHSQRIVKFFHQLGERGQQQDWVAWLERFKDKILSNPSVSVQQMATTMIRLGELTQSTPQVQQIGTISYQIGLQVLFGDTSDLIWEYHGADVQANSQSNVANNSAETKDESLSELNSDLTSEIDNNLSSEIELNVSEASIVNANLETFESTTEDISLELNLENNFSDTLEKSESARENISPELDLEHNAHNAVETPIDNANLASSESTRKNIAPALDSDDNFQDSQEFNQKSLENQNPNSSNSADNQLDEPDWLDLIEKIQEHDKLVQRISKKLNISSTDSSISTNFHQQQLDNINSNNSDNSVIELVESWFNLGLKQVSTGDFRGAIVSWEKALNLNPNLSEAWHNRGSALGRLNRYEEAIESFERSLSIASNNYQAWNDRAHALYQLQKWQEATESWDKAIEIMPGNHLFWYNRGCALEQLNNIEESIVSYEKALEIKPDFQPARSRYINLVADNFPPN